MSQHFSIGTTDVRSDDSVRVLEGALAVQPLSRNLAGFDNYFTSLGPSHSAVNPWFGESLIEYCKKQNSASRYRLPSILVSFLTQTFSFSFSFTPISTSFPSWGVLNTLQSLPKFIFFWVYPFNQVKQNTFRHISFFIFLHSHLLYVPVRKTTLSNIY